MKRMRLDRLTLSAAVVLAGSMWCGAAGAATPEEVVSALQKQREKLKSLHLTTRSTSSRGVRVAEHWEKRDSSDVKFRTAVTVKAADKQKDRGDRRGEAPKADGNKDQKPNLTVFDGQTEWREVQAGDQLLVVKSGQTSQVGLQDVLKELESTKARLRSNETVDGQECVVIEIPQRVDQRDRRRDRSAPASVTTYWIAERYGVVLKRSQTVDGKVVDEMTTTKFEANEPLDASLFTYTPPAGATVVDTRNFGGVDIGKQLGQ